MAERAVEIRQAFQREDHQDLLYAEAVSERSLDKLAQALDARFFYYDVDLDVDFAALRGTAELEDLMARYDPSGR